MRAYLIDAKARTITPFEYERGEFFREHLPGGLGIGWIFDNGDVLYVDDKALLGKATGAAFHINARPDGQPMLSNAVLTGRDWLDNTLPPEFTIEQLQEQITWLGLEQALDWFRVIADQPAVTSKRGDGPIEVHATWGGLLRNLETGDGYQPDQDPNLLAKL
jgi:hypothetical protein